MSFGDYVKGQRIARGLSLRRVSGMAGIDPAYLWRVERGIAPPSDHLVERLATVLQCSPERLSVLAGRVPATVLGLLAEEKGWYGAIRELAALAAAEPTAPYGTASSPARQGNKRTRMRDDRSPTLPLFSTNAPPLQSEPVGSQRGDDRPIAKNPPPPPHTPTASVPSTLLQLPNPKVAESLRERTEAILSRTRASLGDPYFTSDGVILYRGECVAALQALERSGIHVDLTITSPPYNIGKSYETVRAVDDYIQWCVSWIAAIYRTTAPAGAFWLNLGYLPVPGKGKAVPIPYLLWDKTPFSLVQEVVWNYGAGVTAKRSFAPRNEKWLFYVKNEETYTFDLDAVRDPNVKYPNQKKNGKYRCNPLGKNPSDVWQFPKVTTGENRSSRERTSHPAQFPLGIVERIVRVSSSVGDLVVDPFSGSASTGIAAVGTGRIYLGFEIREDYCHLSVERFRHFFRMREDSVRQGSLLSSPTEPSA